MTQIVLTAEQSTQLASAQGRVVLVNPQGQTVGDVSPKYAPSRFSPEEIAAAEAKISMDGPYITTAELLDRLKKLDPRR